MFAWSLQVPLQGSANSTLCGTSPVQFFHFLMPLLVVLITLPINLIKLQLGGCFWELDLRQQHPVT